MEKNTKRSLINAIMALVVVIAGFLIIFTAINLFLDAAEWESQPGDHPGKGVIFAFGFVILSAALVGASAFLLELTLALAGMFACHAYSYAKIAIREGEDNRKLPRILLIVTTIEFIMIIAIAVILAIAASIMIINAITKV